MNEFQEQALDQLHAQIDQLLDELSEERERSGRLRKLVDQLTQERDAARMDARHVAGRRSFMP